jgi:hypothetical protein
MRSKKKSKKRSGCEITREVGKTRNVASSNVEHLSEEEEYMWHNSVQRDTEFLETLEKAASDVLVQRCEEFHLRELQRTEQEDALRLLDSHLRLLGVTGPLGLIRSVDKESENAAGS